MLLLVQLKFHLIQNIEFHLITVIEDHTSASIIKLDKAAIKRTGAVTFTGLLESIPSVSFEGGQGNLQALRIRGNEASHTLLLLDGQEVSAGGTQPNLDAIPLDQIERIEITKGPFFLIIWSRSYRWCNSCFYR